MNVNVVKLESKKYPTLKSINSFKKWSESFGREKNWSPKKKILWTSKYKQDGTAIIVTNIIRDKITKSGQYPEGLGRWSFTSMEGENQNKLIVINTYTPCKITEDKVISKVSNQQWYLLENQGRESENIRDTKTINNIQINNIHINAPLSHITNWFNWSIWYKRTSNPVPGRPYWYEWPNII